MSYEIITESTANLTAEITEEYNIKVLPFTYHMKGTDYAPLNTESFDEKTFYSSIRQGERVATSQINPQQYSEIFEPILKQGKDILFIGLSSRVSGSFSSATTAKEDLEKEYPSRRIVLIDSKGASLGQGIPVIRAAEMRNEGIGIDDTEKQIIKLVKRMYQIFTVDDLSHLKRTGRLSNVSAAVGTIIGIKPLLKGDREGKIVAFKKCRGRKNTVRTLVEKYKDLAVNAKEQTVGISHADCIEDAELLAEMISEHITPKRIIIVKHEPVTGSHLGPGALALYFEGNDDVREK